MTNKKLDLNLIQTFLIAAEYQSYTKAAEHLGVTQPAVSASIRRLEALIEYQLFTKVGRSISLTSRGQNLLPKLRQALCMVENALSISPQFKVYCSEVFSGSLSSINNVSVHEAAATKNLLLELLHQQKIALVIDSIKSDDSTLVNEVIHEEPNVVVCRKTHPRINGQINTKQFFKEKHCVLTDEWAVNQTTNHSQYLNNVQVETVASSLSGVVLNVIESDNIAIIPHSFAMKWKKQLDLQVIDLPIESNLVTYHFIYHKREKNNLHHKLIRNNIKETLKPFYKS
ncbi:LysR family transcriptional regulator [Vibrio parahaemolyticus]|nr:LysR family transcriptional regulator [Vibrio parahaemolyticus]